MPDYAASIILPNTQAPLGTGIITITGSESFMLLIGDTNGIPAIKMNGYLCMKGGETDPTDFDIGIAGNNNYMMGIESDIGSAPTLIVKGGSGEIYTGYDAAGNKVFFVDNDGSCTFGLSSLATVWVGQNVSGQNAVKTATGRIESYFNAETHPRFLVHANGSVSFSLDGTVAPALNAVRFGIQSAGVAKIDVTDGSALVTQVIVGLALTRFGQSGQTTANAVQIEGGGIVGLRMKANGEATDEKLWSWQTGADLGGGILRLRAINDAESAGINAIVITRDGVTSLSTNFQSDTTFGIPSDTAARTRRLEGGALVSDEIVLNDADVDEKRWHWQSGSTIGSGVLRLRCVDDAQTTGVNALQFTRDGIVSVSTDFQAGPVGFTSYTVAGLPSASTAGRMVYVSNESGGAVMAFSDGTNWRRVTDRAVVS